jgi:hypothetical protein
LGCVLAGYAQVTFNPDMLVLSLDSGQSKSADVVVRNDAGVAKAIKMKLNYRRQGKLTGRAEDWCSVRPNSFTLAAGGSQAVHLEFKGPATLPGECVLSLSAGEMLKTPIPLDVRMGMPVFVRCNGEKRILGEIVGVEPRRAAGNQMEVNVRVKNMGALHLVPFGLAWLEDARRNRVWQADLRCGQPVFPGEVLSLCARASAPVWQGAGTLHVQMFWGTLYGNQAVGVPASSAKQVPLSAASLK